MGNRETSATWTYHNGTKHSYWSIRSSHHSLDWANQPVPLKIYKSLEGIRLPQRGAASGLSAFAAISHPPVQADGERIPSQVTLAQILYLSAGITRRREYPGGQTFFRAAACTGALYHIDLYLVCRELPDLEAGVYHFGPHDFSLRRLRSGDYRDVLVQAGAGETSIARAPAVIVCADTYWRNSWKYQARAYRHSFWDSGTILANLLAVAAAHHVPSQVVVNFVDSQVNRLLGLDGEGEVALVLVPLGWTDDMVGNGVASLEALSYETEPLSVSEVDYPAIRDMHRSSSLETVEDVEGLRCIQSSQSLSKPVGKLYPLSPLSGPDMPDTSIEDAILRRGSTRKFSTDPITMAQLSTILDLSTSGIQADFLRPFGASLNQLYLIINAVEGLPSGSYLYHPDRKALELLREGNFRSQAGYLGLEQDIPADASVDVFFLADLEPVLERYGNRGYRMAQLEAGIIGGRAYLAAYAQKLGASGLTFYDDDVTEFFSPSARGKSVMFLVALGRSVQRRKASPIKGV